MATGEYVQGHESHTSTWAKFYVKGLEPWSVKEEFTANRQDRHHSYQGYVCLGVPAGTVFSIFSQSVQRGTGAWTFTICATIGGDDAPGQQAEGAYPERMWVKGHWCLLARAEGQVKAPRLMEWWNKRPADLDPIAYAQHCAAHIEKRGVKVRPPMAGTPRKETVVTVQEILSKKIEELRAAHAPRCRGHSRSHHL